jgi:hypothetical protein
MRRAARPARPRRDAAGDRAEVVRRLRDIQRAARALRRDARAPVVERVAQIIETECHLARWALGDVQGITPEAGRRP